MVERVLGHHDRATALRADAGRRRVGEHLIHELRSSPGVWYSSTAPSNSSARPGTGSEITGAPQASTSYRRFDTKPHRCIVRQWSLSTTPADE